MKQLARLSADNEILFFTNRNTLANISESLDGVQVVTPRMLSFGALSAVIWSMFFFPISSFLRRVGVCMILTNPVVLLPLRPTVSVIHDLNEFEMDAKYGWLRTFYRKRVMLASAVANSRKVIISSEFSKRQLLQFFPNVNVDRTEVIKVGVEIGAGLEVVSSPGSVEVRPEPFYLIVGRLDPRGKNLPAAVELYCQLEKFRPGHKLLLVGGINEFSRTEAEEFLADIKQDSFLKSRVSYLGYVDDDTLASLYNAATAVIFMSRYEGFGLPLIEAFKAGCPVIYNSDCEVLREHAEDAGLGVNKGADLETLKKTLAVLYDCSARIDLSRRMASVALKYNWEDSARNYLEVVRSVAAGL